SDSGSPNGAEGPRGYLRSSRSWVARALRIRRTLNDKLVVEREANNSTRGQRHCLLEGKPCRLNTIGGVTGTRRANESRTKEQAPEGDGKTARPAESSEIQTGARHISEINVGGLPSNPRTYR